MGGGRAHGTRLVCCCGGCWDGGWEDTWALGFDWSSAAVGAGGLGQAVTPSVSAWEDVRDILWLIFALDPREYFYRVCLGFRAKHGTKGTHVET